MEEIWEDVLGYENIYEVSNYGRVRTHKDKTTFTKHHGIRKWQQIFLKEKNPSGRDVRVSLWKNGEHKDYLVHRLVAVAFIPQVPGKECVNHIDGNPRNNHVSNLEWCNHKENNDHAFDNGLMTTNKVVFLVDKETGESKYFRSFRRASQYLGKDHGFISRIIKEGKHEIDNYRIFLAIKPHLYDEFNRLEMS